jgi:hypothetical protein
MCLIGTLSHSIMIFLLGSSLIFGPSLGYPPNRLTTFNLVYYVFIVITWISVCIQWFHDSHNHDPQMLLPSPIQLTNNEHSFSVVCPICRQDNVVLENQSKVYGVDTKCVICLEQACEVYLPSCGHICICYKCALHGRAKEPLPPV